MTRLPAADRRRSTRGLTLIEVLVAMAVMAGLFVIVWATMDRSRRTFVQVAAMQDRWHVVRSGMQRIAEDLTMAYVSVGENMSEVNRRTFFKLAKGDHGPELRFSSFAHRRLVEGSRESDQCVIQYFMAADPDAKGQVALFRRESRRLAYEPPESLIGEAYVLVDDVIDVRYEFFDRQNDKWLEEWDTTAVDGQPNRLPNLVRIHLTVKGEDGKEMTLVTQVAPPLVDGINLAPAQAGATGTQAPGTAAGAVTNPFGQGSITGPGRPGGISPITPGRGK